MKKFFCFLILTTIFLSFRADAIVEAKKISLQEALQIVLNTNPQIKIAKLEVIQSENNIKSSNSLKNPSIGTFQNIGKTALGNSQQIGADWVIEVLKRGKKKSVAKSNLEISKNDEKFLEQKMILDVKIAYFDFLLKKSNLKLIEEQKEISKQILNQIEKEHKNKTDVIQAKIDYNRSIMYYNVAKSELISSQNRFNSIMNSNNIDYDVQESELSNDYASFLTIEPEKTFLNFEKIKAYALQNRYDLKSLENQVLMAENNLKLVKSQLIPDLQVEGGYAYKTAGIAESGKFENGAYAGVNLVNIPLIYHYKPEINNAKLEIEKTKLKYEDLKIDIIRDITDAWEKYEITRNNLNFYNNELLKNSKELLDESIKSLDKKKINLTDFLVSKKSHLELMLGYEQALNDYYVAFAELLKELNIKNYNELI